MKKYIGIYTDASLDEVKSALDAVVLTVLANEFALLPTENDKFFEQRVDNMPLVVWSFDFIETMGVTYNEFIRECLPILSYKLETLFNADICEFYYLAVK